MAEGLEERGSFGASKDLARPSCDSGSRMLVGRRLAGRREVAMDGTISDGLGRGFCICANNIGHVYSS